MRQQLQLPDSLVGNLWHYRNLGRVHAMHHHAELEFNLVTRGRGQYLLQKRKYQIRGGDLLWLFPAQEHVLVEQTLDFEMWIGVCKPATVLRSATDGSMAVLRQRNPPGDYCRRLPRPISARLESLFCEIASTRDQPGMFNAGLVYAFLSAWRHFQKAAEAPADDIHPAVEKAARLIRDGGPALSLDELGQRSGLSRGRLSRLFKQQTGIALVDFRNRQRVERFLQRYGAGQRMTMLEAALEAGFGSYPQFHRVFKRVIGCSPRRHRISPAMPVAPQTVTV